MYARMQEEAGVKELKEEEVLTFTFFQKYFCNQLLKISTFIQSYSGLKIVRTELNPRAQWNKGNY